VLPRGVAARDIDSRPRRVKRRNDLDRGGLRRGCLRLNTDFVGESGAPIDRPECDFAPGHADNDRGEAPFVKEPGGTYALYHAPLLDGQAPQVVRCTSM